MDDLFLHTYTKKGIDGVLIFISVPINQTAFIIFCATQRSNVGTKLQPFETMSQQC